MQNSKTNRSSNFSFVHENDIDHLNAAAGLDFGNEAFMIFSASVLWMMIPGCGLFYSGMARSKSALSMMTLSLWSVAIASIQWFVFGYSLVFSLTSDNPFIGNFQKAFYMGVCSDFFPTAKRISEASFCFYQGVTSTLPAALISGALAERARIMPALVFILLWNTLVYCPCAYWSLNPNGWSFRAGILDFGGGAPVHVPAATASLVYSYILGPRLPSDKIAKPHNMVCLFMGTVFIWFGSFGYNCGSAFGATTQAVMSCIIVNLSGSIGAVTWAILDYVSEKKCSAFGFCAGAVVGLIVITPASGFIAPACAFPFAIVGVVLCRWVNIVVTKWKFDDALDVFAMHGVAGIVGILLAGIFSQKRYGGEDIEAGGWLDGNFKQIFIQMLDTVAGCVYSASVSFLLLVIMNKIPALRLRLEPIAMMEGMDIHQLGVSCYEHIEEIKIQLDCATWRIMPDEQGNSHHPLVLEKMRTVSKLPEPSSITDRKNDFSHNHNNNGNGNDDTTRADDEFIVLPNNWRDYWY